MSGAHRRSGIDPNDPQAVGRIAEMLRVWNGEGREPQQRVVTEKQLRQMLDEGGGNLREAFRNAVQRNLREDSESTDSDPTIEVPQQPTILSVDIGFDTAMFRWDSPGYDGHAYTEVWRNVAATEFESGRVYAKGEVVAYQGSVYRARRQLEEPPAPEDGEDWERIDDLDQMVGDATGDDRNGAALLTITQGRSFVDSSLIPDVTYYFWFRFVNQLGNPGPWHDQQGIEVRLETRPSQLIAELAGQIEETELSQRLRDRVDLVDGPEDLDFSVSWRLRQEAEERSAEIQREIEDLEGQFNEVFGSLTALLEAPEFDEDSGYSEGDVVVWCEKLYRARVDMEPPAPHPEDPEAWAKIGSHRSVNEALAAQAVTLRDHAAEIQRNGNKLTAVARDIQGLAARIEDPESGLESRATVQEMNEALATEEEARATQIGRLEGRLGPPPFHPFRDYYEGDEVAHQGSVYRLVVEQVTPDTDREPPQDAPGESDDWEFVEELDDATLSSAMMTRFDQALASEQQARLSQFDEAEARIDGNEGSITELREVDARQDGVRALDSSGQEVRYLGNRFNSQARNEIFRASVADAEQSLATRYQMLEAAFARNADELSNRATISQLEEVKATEDEARATALRQVEAAFGVEHPFWDSAADYEIGDKVIYLGTLYEALKVMQAPSPNPRHGEEGHWAEVEDIATTAGHVERLEEAIADEEGARAEELGSVRARFTRNDFRMDGQDQRMDFQNETLGLLSQAKADVSQLDQAIANMEGALARSMRQVNALLGTDYDYWTPDRPFLKGSRVYWEGSVWEAERDFEAGEAQPNASWEWKEVESPQTMSAAVQERMKASVDGEAPNAQWGIFLETTNEGRVVTSGFGIEDEDGDVTFGVDAHTFFVRHPDAAEQWYAWANYQRGDVVHYDGDLYIAMHDMGAIQESPFHENTVSPDQDPQKEIVVENDDLPADEDEPTEDEWGTPLPNRRRYGTRSLWRYVGPVGANYPFIVDATTGRVMINSAHIPFASIEYAHMGEAFVEGLRATQVFADRAEFDRLNVFDLLQIGSTERIGENAAIESANWNDGTGYGFRLDNQGNFALKSRPAGGRVEHNANGVQVYDDNGRLRVVLGRLVR